MEPSNHIFVSRKCSMSSQNSPTLIDRTQKSI